MNKSTQSELASYQASLVGFSILSLGFLGVVVGLVWGNPERVSGSMPTALALMLLAGLAWAAGNWHKSAAAWLAIGGLTAGVWMITLWVGVPVSGFLMIPCMLGLVVLGVLPGILLTLANTTALLAWAGAGGAPAESAVWLMWAVVGVTLVIFQPARRLMDWAWDSYLKAQKQVDQLRSNQAELAQALEDLGHATRQLAQMNERVEVARRVAEEAEHTKAVFVANVSHEFRTPLNMIIGLTHLILVKPEVYGEELPPALLEDLEIVQRNCDHLLSMINDVLDLSQIEAGRLAVRKERIDFLEIAANAIDVVRPLTEKKGLSIRSLMSETLPQVYCDRTRIRQVLVNLLGNAARFTERGEITLEAQLEGSSLVVCVGDSGPGISAADAQHIFETFYQGENNRDGSKGGSGLGLSISKQFIEMHNGQMWIDSAPGTGSRFYFKLPVDPPMEPIARGERWLVEDWEYRVRHRPPGGGLDVGPRKPLVVLCDEAGDLLSSVTRYADNLEWVGTRSMEESFMEVERRAALTLVINSALPQNLPQMVERARQELPGVVVLGCALPQKKEHVHAAGAFDFLQKPISQAGLETALTQTGLPIRQVLLVEDNPDTRQLFTRMLHAYHPQIKVISASNGSEGLAAMRDSLPDLVMLDLVLPDMDGWHVLGIKGQDTEIREIPVLIVSAQDPAEQPLSTRALMVTAGAGMTLGQILKCVEAMPVLLLAGAVPSSGRALPGAQG